MGKAFVLLSGGIDSTVCLYLAGEQHKEVSAISVFYQQRHNIEIEYARKSCAALGIDHRVIDLSSIIPKTMLTDTGSEIPNKSYADIEGISPMYVPFRNGLMLSAITSIVAGLVENDVGEDYFIYFGAHSEDAENWAYADCSPEFIGAMANAIYIGSYRHVRLATPLQWLNKTGVVRLGSELGVDWSNTFSCYVGQAKHCGNCPTCRSRKVAFKNAQVSDPTSYEV